MGGKISHLIKKLEADNILYHKQTGFTYLLWVASAYTLQVNIFPLHRHYYLEVLFPSGIVDVLYVCLIFSSPTYSGIQYRQRKISSLWNSQITKIIFRSVRKFDKIPPPATEYLSLVETILTFKLSLRLQVRTSPRFLTSYNSLYCYQNLIHSQ